MRCLERNKRRIYFSEYGSNEATDKYGNVSSGYGGAKEININVTQGTSKANVKLYGGVSYDRELITCDMSCPIGDKTRLWIGIEPTETFNYIVVSEPATSLNSKSYPIKKVNTS